MRTTAARASATLVDVDTVAEILSWARRKRNEGVWIARIAQKPAGGFRVIHAPCPPLKELLKDLNRRHLAPLDTGRFAFCRKGAGVLKAVRLHRAHPALLHRDLRDFFPSITQTMVCRTLVRRGFSHLTATVLARLCTLHDELVQGSPASVTLGNLVLARLDGRIGKLCEVNGLTYTRYVDDIAVSGGAARLSTLGDRIDRIIDEEGWTCGAKGGLFAPGEYREYLGVDIGKRLRVGARAKSRALQAHDALESGLIDYAEFQVRTGWVRAVEGPTMPSVMDPKSTVM